MINFLFIILLFSFKNSISNEVEPIVIEQNCKSCHGKDYSGNTYIKSIKDLDKETFIKKMEDYKKNNDNSIMSRIVKVLSVNDIKEIAKIIYD